MIRDFHRARVTLEASRPLVHFVTLAPEGCEPMLLQVYEKLPHFCANCGHVHLECSTGELLEDELQYGDWMIAGADTWCIGTPHVHSSFGSEQGRTRTREEVKNTHRIPSDRRWTRGHGGRGGVPWEGW
jgi:hypothetical protein